MPRINQLPVASSVAQTDVLAIDTPDKTYKVPRSVLAPAPFQVTIQPGYWSGSGSDYYFTVSASNVTGNAQLYPFYDKASDALLNGPVWAIPAAGSFTIHTSAIPSGTVTISVLLAGIVGEAQYQVLADVYSKSQVDLKIQQSTAYRDYNVSIPAYAAGTAGNRAGQVTVSAALSGYVPVSACIGAYFADTYCKTSVQLDGASSGIRVNTHYGDGRAIDAHTITVRVFYVKS